MFISTEALAASCTVFNQVARLKNTSFKSKFLTLMLLGDFIHGDPQVSSSSQCWFIAQTFQKLN